MIAKHDGYCRGKYRKHAKGYWPNGREKKFYKGHKKTNNMRFGVTANEAANAFMLSTGYRRNLDRVKMHTGVALWSTEKLRQMTTGAA